MDRDGAAHLSETVHEHVGLNGIVAQLAIRRVSRDLVVPSVFGRRVAATWYLRRGTCRVAAKFLRHCVLKANCEKDLSRLCPAHSGVFFSNTYKRLILFMMSAVPFRSVSITLKPTFHTQSNDQHVDLRANRDLPWLYKRKHGISRSQFARRPIV